MRPYLRKTFNLTNSIVLLNFSSLLIVPKYKGDWKYLIHSNMNEHTVSAYVWNKTDEICSEFGDIAVQSACGGIRRIA